jgi:hypothetical protein
VIVNIVVERICMVFDLTTVLTFLSNNVLTPFLPFIVLALLATKSFASTEPCNEEVPRRYWIGVKGLYVDNFLLPFADRLKIRLARDALIRLGFRMDRRSPPDCLFIGWNRAEIRTLTFEAEKLVSKLPGGNGIRITVTVQPRCTSCGTLARFRDKYCKNCGSKDLSPRGIYYYKTDRIAFIKD